MFVWCTNHDALTVRRRCRLLLPEEPAACNQTAVPRGLQCGDCNARSSTNERQRREKTTQPAPNRKGGERQRKKSCCALTSVGIRVRCCGSAAAVSFPAVEELGPFGHLGVDPFRLSNQRRGSRCEPVFDSRKQTCTTTAHYRSNYLGLSWVGGEGGRRREEEEEERREEERRRGRKEGRTAAHPERPQLVRITPAPPYVPAEHLDTLRSPGLQSQHASLYKAPQAC